MIYQLVNKRTEILPLATSHIAVYATSLIVFALPIPMPCFKSNNFDQNRPKIKLFGKTFLSAGGLAPRPLKQHPNHCGFLATSLMQSHPMRLALSDVEPQFQKMLKRNVNKCCVIKFVFFSFCSSQQARRQNSVTGGQK